MESPKGLKLKGHCTSIHMKIEYIRLNYDAGEIKHVTSSGVNTIKCKKAHFGRISEVLAFVEYYTKEYGFEVKSVIETAMGSHGKFTISFILVKG